MAQRAVAVLGLGEAGGRFAVDLVGAGATVSGFDPRVSAPPGVTHAKRRADEMAAAAALLDDLGVPARIARASRDRFNDLSAT
ncbi:DUF1932 domain-containing protein [Asanoa sp. NPDC049573]|uniref:DUF1932 domain-containing protein n=1 Tax=Asanoa sp. NPDC049573 TaxID=3155396 RepID=UPI0034405557